MDVVGPFTWARFTVHVDWPEAEGVEGAIDVRRIRVSEPGLGVCEVGVQVDNEWETCMEETYMEWCGTTCADLRSNPYHCGECGDFWGDDDHGGWCEGGERVPDPQLTLLAPDHMDGCEPGYFGRDCAFPCPGLLEAGTACSGRGVCDDGPLGGACCRVASKGNPTGCLIRNVTRSRPVCWDRLRPSRTRGLGRRRTSVLRQAFTRR
jgi:hypothetical protein